MRLSIRSVPVRTAVAAAGAAIAIGGAGVVSAAPAAACSGVGYHLANDNVRNRPNLTITFDSQSTKNATSHYFQDAINEIQRQTRTRISIGGINATRAADRIVVRTVNSGESCGGTPSNQWSGCTTNDRPNNVVSNARITFKPSAHGSSKSLEFKHALTAHELGHALGLWHTSDSSQLMHATVNSADYANNVAYKSGDIKGLRYLAR